MRQHTKKNGTQVLQASNGKMAGSIPSQTTPSPLDVRINLTEQQQVARAALVVLEQRVSVDVSDALSEQCARRIHARMSDINAALDAGDIENDYESGIRQRYVGDVAEKATTEWINGELGRVGLEANAHSLSNHGREDITVPGSHITIDVKTRPWGAVREFGMHILSGKIDGALRREEDPRNPAEIFIQTGYEYRDTHQGDVEHALGIDRKVTKVIVYAWAYAADYKDDADLVVTSSGENRELPWEMARLPQEFLEDAVLFNETSENA